MRYFTIDTPGALCRVAVFIPGGEGRAEAHAVITGTLAGEPFGSQLDAVLAADAALPGELRELTARVFGPVMCRCFLSDPANQAALLPAADTCARGVVGQAPLDGTKAAMWVWLQEDAGCHRVADGVWTDGRGQMWQGDPAGSRPGDSATLTAEALARTRDILAGMGGTLADHCVRTWFAVRDVDSNYGGVVTARNELFAAEGLTADTHFIASTGIGGSAADPRQTVSYNAYADTRLTPSDITFLKGATHLNPTAEYGVAFERATATDYADRREVFVSGTASIDNRGRIVAPGDIVAQTHRMLENIEVLLAEGGCSMDDVAQMLVYLRDTADHAVVRGIFDARLPRVPRVILLAPVCRPGWLIETECIAIKGISAESGRGKVAY